jgi:hypothetical protein
MKSYKSKREGSAVTFVLKAVFTETGDRHCEVRSNPVYAHGLLHYVRNDGGCYGDRYGEVLRGVARYGAKQSNPVYAHGLLHCVRNDGGRWRRDVACYVSTGCTGIRSVIPALSL